MIWPFGRRSTVQPSQAAQESLVAGQRELHEARELRAESSRVGQSLRRVHEQNHIAEALIEAVKIKREASA